MGKANVVRQVGVHKWPAVSSDELACLPTSTRADVRMVQPDPYDGRMADDIERALQTVRQRLHLGRCPTCKISTPLSHLGHNALCERCTVAEVGLTMRENAARIECGMTVAQFLKRPADAPLPTRYASATKRRLASR